MSEGFKPFIKGLYDAAPKCKECGEMREYWDDELCVKCRKKKRGEEMTENQTCPFCGGSPRREFDSHRNDFCRTRYRIVCTSCYAGTRWYDDPDEAWLMWNGRVKE